MPSNQKSIFLRLLSISKPEWIFLCIGCIASLLNGVGQVVFAILLAHVINVSDPSK